MARNDSWLVATNLHYVLPNGRELYRGLELSLGSGITALIGENGAGKTTLAAQLAGIIPAESSTNIQRHGRIGYLRQQTVRPERGSRLVDFLESASLFTALGRIENGEGENADFEMAEGNWDRPARLASLLNSVGLPFLEPFSCIDNLSGGELARLALLQVLYGDPDHLILDEPGNHLDREGRGQLIDLLRGFPGGILLISHDRQLIELANTLLDLGPWGVRSFSGSYAEYREQRKALQEKQQRDIEIEQRRVQQQQREAQRNLEKHQRRASKGKAARRSGSQSTLILDMQAERSERTRGRLRHLAEDRLRHANERLANVEAKKDEANRAQLAVAGVSVSGGVRPILHCENVCYRYQESQPLIEGFSLQLAVGERLELRGPNGSGKSTLLRILSGELAAQSGEVYSRVPLARLDQHLSLFFLQQDAVENFLRLAPGLALHEYYARLVAMGLPRERANLPVAALSGGEQVRLALACLLLGPEPAQLLLLDEPSNHLDLVATEVLENALHAYPGALIVVSHDDRFLQQVGISRVIDMPATGD